jgi:hypothetical protein
MSDPTNDDGLVAELREAVRAAGEVPERFLDAGRAAFAWRIADAELARLTRDSATEPVGAATRAAEPTTVRSVSFVARELSIEVDLTDDALRGQVVPPQPGEVDLRRSDGSIRTVPVDEVGWFVIRPVPHMMFRLHVRTADGVTVITQWLTHGPGG